MLNNIVHNQDCMEGMASMPDKYYDLAIVDPPYGIGEDGRKNHTRGKLAKAKDYRDNDRYDECTPDQFYFDELFRVSKNQIIWGGNYFLDKIPVPTSCMIVWDKVNGDSDFADCELAWTSFNSAVRRFTYMWSGMLQQDMKNKEHRIHPNHKPVALYRWILQNYSKSGDKILDTHTGGGSSRIACYDMNLDFTGYEISKIYFTAQELRFQRHKAQLKLFI